MGILEFKEIVNHYGSLELWEREDGSVVWGIANHSGIDWYEIPRYLSDALKKYHEERNKD